MPLTENVPVEVNWPVGPVGPRFCVCPLIPSFTPEGPSELNVYCYAGTWISWKALIVDICDAARIAAPVISLQCLRDPLVPAVAAIAAKRDPDAAVFWDPYHGDDLDAELAAARAAGHELPPFLTIVFDIHAAAGKGGDEALRHLYDAYRGDTVLMAGTETDLPWAGEYGAVVELPPLHHSIGWRDLLARLTGGDIPTDDQVTVVRDFEPPVAPPEGRRAVGSARRRRRE